MVVNVITVVIVCNIINSNQNIFLDDISKEYFFKEKHLFKSHTKKRIHQK